MAPANQIIFGNSDRRCKVLQMPWQAYFDIEPVMAGRESITDEVLRSINYHRFAAYAGYDVLAAADTREGLAAELWRRHKKRYFTSAEVYEIPGECLADIACDAPRKKANNIVRMRRASA